MYSISILKQGKFTVAASTADFSLACTMCTSLCDPVLEVSAAPGSFPSMKSQEKYANHFQSAFL